MQGSLKALLNPKYKTVDAVRNVNFRVEKGEILAFIGPNGAGKSTTIKMLTGLLYPSSGSAEILGLNPWKQRRQLAYRIGTVFGQKAQLWYYLPLLDTFNLLAKIYELDQKEFRAQADMLIELFKLQDFLNTPVRKLSLGQRMKCEITASLLHKPELVFLDEPTIGLDVIAKQQIREAILAMNEINKTTIFLTSHDAGDIESICQRVIVVNNGEVIFDDPLSSLKKGFLTHKNIEVRFSEPLHGEFALPGVEVIKSTQHSVKLRVNTGSDSVSQIMKQIIDGYAVSDFNVDDPTMEEIIRTIYNTQPLHNEKEAMSIEAQS